MVCSFIFKHFCIFFFFVFCFMCFNKQLIFGIWKLFALSYSKKQEYPTSQRVCRWSVALFSSIFVFLWVGGPPIYVCIQFGKATAQALCMPSYMLLPNLLPSFAKLCQIEIYGGYPPPSTGGPIRFPLPPTVSAVSKALRVLK